MPIPQIRRALLVTVAKRMPAVVRWELLRRLDNGMTAAQSLGVSVGQGSRVFTRGFGSEPWLVEIGRDTTISVRVEFITHDGAGWLFRDAQGARSRHSGIRVGDHVFVGARAILMPGVVIEDRCVVAAGAVVTRSVPTNSVVAGVPARIIGRFDDLERKALATWPTEQSGAGLSFRERVESQREHKPAPFLHEG